MGTLYITGAGVSSDSGIPTFRGADGFWTIGSENYTPEEMAIKLNEDLVAMRVNEIARKINAF